MIGATTSAVAARPAGIRTTRTIATIATVLHHAPAARSTRPTHRAASAVGGWRRGGTLRDVRSWRRTLWLARGASSTRPLPSATTVRRTMTTHAAIVVGRTARFDDAPVVVETIGPSHAVIIAGVPARLDTQTIAAVVMPPSAVRVVDLWD